MGRPKIDRNLTEDELNNRNINKERLILGCGFYPDLNSINHDLSKHHNYIDVVWDLNKLPWPWEDDSFIFIESRSVFEHLRYVNLLEALNECHRIIKDGGILFLKLPVWNSERTWKDPTHVRGYTLNSVDYVDPETKLGKEYGFYTDKKWKILKVGYGSEAKSSILWDLKAIK